MRLNDVTCNYDKIMIDLLYKPFFKSTSQSLHLNISFSPSHNDSIICSADTISRLLHVALRMAGVQPYLRVGTSAMSHVDITNCHNFKSLEFADFPHQHTHTYHHVPIYACLQLVHKKQWSTLQKLNVTK